MKPDLDAIRARVIFANQVNSDEKFGRVCRKLTNQYIPQLLNYINKLEKLIATTPVCYCTYKDDECSGKKCPQSKFCKLQTELQEAANED